MDSELFTVDGGIYPFTSKGVVTHENVDTKHVQLSLVKLMHTTKWVLRAVFVVVFLYALLQFVSFLPIAYKKWNEGFFKSGFSQKENLQYLGASTAVTRDDTGWTTKDSLAEQALKAQLKYTDLSVSPQASKEANGEQADQSTSGVGTPTQGFRSRDHFMTPEEEQMKKIAGQ